MSRYGNTILVVDDEPKIMEVLKSFLESKGFLVACAENGKKALALFDQEPVAMVLLDLMLPDITGEAVCATIRQKSRVPIIMLTAKIEEEALLKGLAAGADDYLTKPFSLKELHARMEAVLRRSNDNLQPLYQKNMWGSDLEIDPRNHDVRKKNQPVKLTPSEYNILMALIKYPNKTFTREELIGLALGSEFDGYNRAIDNYIKNLRQKIEDNPKEPVYILTVHGIGYKFGGGKFETI